MSDSIWQWQTISSLAIPISSILGSFFVAFMTAKWSDKRREKDQAAEDLRHKDEREARFQEITLTNDRINKERQRTAVIEGRTAFYNAWNAYIDRINNAITEARLENPNESAHTIKMWAHHKKYEATLELARRNRRTTLILMLNLTNKELSLKAKILYDKVTEIEKEVMDLIPEIEPRSVLLDDYQSIEKFDYPLDEVEHILREIDDSAIFNLR